MPKQIGGRSLYANRCARGLRNNAGWVRYGAALDQLRDYRPEICHPILAPFALYGVSPRSNLRKVLDHPASARETGGREPDICLLDLGPPSLTRLGHGWEEVLERFLAETLARFPNLPVLAVTHDAYVHRRVAKLIKVRRPTGDCPASSVLIRATENLMTADPVTSGFSRISVQVHSAGLTRVQAAYGRNHAREALNCFLGQLRIDSLRALRRFLMSDLFWLTEGLLRLHLVLGLRAESEAMPGVAEQ